MLTDHDDERLAIGLVRLATAMHAATDGHASGGPTTLVDQQVILMLSQRGDKQSIEELASSLGMSLPDLVEAVGRLRVEGLVGLDPAPSYDPGHVRVSLTGPGRDLAPPLLNWAAHLLGRLDDLSADVPDLPVLPAVRARRAGEAAPLRPCRRAVRAHPHPAPLPGAAAGRQPDHLASFGRPGQRCPGR
ncbi:hypothetical protein [Rugosimonospora africana]|uniref:MarR family protein n=1 Tax=Rugosimonospora africana TaxID=556532 RepID=A0A8J3QY97_9ACTN|nr:hypothetical protein [Rugosimonospora africana]GIH18068.1 hypothetical protein Raf01_62400 [Rugosimonospora africana]